MSSDSSVEFWGTLIVFVIVCVGYLVFGSMSCSAKWEQSGLSSSFGPIKGCMVQLRDGRWLPADRIRETDIAPKDPPPKALPPT